MRILVTILFLLCFAVSQATTYTATSVAEANTFIAAAVSGDVIQFTTNDTHTGRILVSGKNNITIRGNGAMPIITARSSISGWNTGANWVDQGGNVWMWENVSNPYDKAWRIWLNGVEYAKAATSGAVNSTKRYNHLTSTYDLYVYATSNPATFYSNIEYSGTEQQTIYITNSTNITIENIDFRGGMAATMDIDFSSNITVQNCKIGRDGSGMGIRFNGTCEDNNILDNEVISGCKFINDFYEAHGTVDGIFLTGGCNNNDIGRNKVWNWGHSNIELSNLSGTPMTGNDIFENELRGDSVDYVRGIGVDDVNDGSTGNRVFRNLIRKNPIRSQVNMAYLEFSYNIIDSTTNHCPYRSDPVGQGLDISGYSGTKPKFMKIHNNLFKDNVEAAIIMMGGGGTYQDAEDNEISNNIFYNNAIDPKTYFTVTMPYQVVIDDDADVLDNTWRNNLFYKSGVTYLIYYGHDASNDYPHTVEEFNAENGTASDVISGNITGDPLLNGNGSLQPGSPAINAGYTLAEEYSIGLNPSSVWPADVITRIQNGSFDIGAFVYTVSVGTRIFKSNNKILIHNGKILKTANE